MVFSPTHPFMCGTVYHKNWQNHEMGKKNRCSKLAKKIRLMIYQTLCILSLIKNHKQKRKFDAICVLENMVSKQFWSFGGLFLTQNCFEGLF